MSSLKDALTKQLLLADAPLPDPIDALLTATSISSGDTQAVSGTAHLDPAAFLKAFGLGSIVNTALGPDIPPIRSSPARSPSCGSCSSIRSGAKARRSRSAISCNDVGARNRVTRKGP
jgi:hypothetical protein